MDNSYNTLFDSDLAENEYIMRQPVKSTKTPPGYLPSDYSRAVDLR